ncbi:MAG TPA: GNAT family N-acetyltransferase [Mycobacteriales bacterium]|nr:GNAT family N-acetyltransferase [Mycobacteriales bacterium]
MTRPAERSCAPSIHELDPHAFRPWVTDAVAVYVSALDPPPEEVSQRRAILERHLDRRGYRAVIAHQDAHLVGFCYGYHGAPGQWWHDVVARGLGRSASRRWLTDTFEVAELHVLPDRQGQGLGRELLTTLLTGCTESSAVLSAYDAATPARSLYRSMGFVDLLTGFRFPGGRREFAVMAKPLR